MLRQFDEKIFILFKFANKLHLKLILMFFFKFGNRFHEKICLAELIL